MKASIIADDHKVDQYLKELKAAGFPVKVSFFTEKKSTLKVPYESKSQQDELTKICRIVEMHFKQGN